MNPTRAGVVWLAAATCAGMLLPGLLMAQATTPSVAASRLVVIPIALRLDVGGTSALRTSAYDAKGVAIARDRYQLIFTLADSTVAAVDTRGLVTGLKLGSTQLTVQLNDLVRDVIVTVGASGTAAVAGAPGAHHPVQLQVTPNPVLLLPSERIHPIVTAVYSDGSHETLAGATWSVFGKEAMFDSVAGDVIGTSPGDATLGVRSLDGTSASVPISVAPVAIATDSVLLEEGTEDTIPVTVPAQNSRRLHRGFSWHTASTEVVRVVSPVLGIVRAGSPGSSEVIADGFGLSQHIPVRVYRHVDLMRFRPDPSAGIRVAVGAAATVTAKALAADSTPVMAVPPTWTVGDTTVATFDARTQRLVGRHPGHTQLECHERNFATTTWLVDVVDGGFGIDRGIPHALTIGAATRATASYRDAQHTSLGFPATLRWSSSDDAVVAIDSSGTITPRRFGHAVIRATGPAGATDSIPVVVTGDVLATRKNAHGSALVAFALQNPQPVALADTNQMTRDGAWSPDHTRITYVSDGGTHGDKWAVYVADADGEHAHPITALGDGWEHPNWSPNGASIAVSMGRIGRRMQLMWLSPDSSTQAPRPLAADRLSLRWPAYDSAGLSLIATGERGDERHLYRVHKSDDVPLTTGKGAEWHPIALGDGSIVYLSDSAGKSDAVRVMQVPAGGGPPSVIVGAGVLPGLTDMTASADGQRLVLVVTTNKRSSLYVIAKPGAAPVPLQPTATDEFSDPAL